MKRMAPQTQHSRINKKPFLLASIILLQVAYLAIWLPSLTAAQSAILYVKPDGDPAADGSSWATATTLTNALNTAPLDSEVWVASGVYTPGNSADDPFLLSRSVSLYGGFAGTETVREERDWESNVTVLSGDVAGDDIRTENGITESASDIVGQNSNHVVVLGSRHGITFTDQTVFDGFVITGGQQESRNDDDMLEPGAGFHCSVLDQSGSLDSQCKLTVQNMRFMGNHSQGYGGALYLDGSALLNNIVFSGNYAQDRGGAIYLTNNQSVLNSITFISNTAGFGGAVYIDGIGNPAVDNTLVTMNDVEFKWNQATGSGGAIYFDGDLSSRVIMNINGGRFLQNNAEKAGGGLSITCGRSWCDLDLNQTMFLGNEAENGGGIYANGSWGSVNVMVKNSLFSGNKASGSGGAIQSNAETEIVNNTFSGNEAILNGGAIYHGGTLWSSSLHLSNSIMWGNIALNEGHQLFSDNRGDLTIDHALSSNRLDDIVNITGTFSIESDLIVEDPRFINPVGADGVAGTEDDDLRLNLFSAAIDSGKNGNKQLESDLDQNPRYVDDAVVLDQGNGDAPIIDLGAYERQSDSILIAIQSLFVPLIQN